MAHKFLKIGIIYFVIAVCLGVFMGATHKFQYAPVHAHLNLLGWVSLVLFGLIYLHFPQMAATKLAKAHFWIYNSVLPIMMTILALYRSGFTALEPVLAVCSISMLISIILFAVNAIKGIK